MSTRIHPSRTTVGALLAALAAVLIATGCGRKPAPEAGMDEVGQASVSVDVVEAHLGKLAEIVEATGTIEAIREVNIGSAASDRIVYIAGDEGDPVSAGQVVVRLDTSDLDASINQAQAGVEAARIRLAQAEQGHELVGISTDTGIETARSQLASARERLSQVETAYELTVRQVDDGVAAAETQLAQARAGLEASRSGLSQTQDTTEANIQSAQAAVRAAEDAYADLARGARSQQREQAQEQVRLAELQVENTRRDLQRMMGLRDAGAVSQQTVDNARLAYDSSVGQLQIAQQALSLTNEGATPEQLRISQAQIDQARQALRSAEAARAQVEQQRQAVRTAEENVTAAEIGVRDAQNRRLTVDTSARDVAAAKEAVAQAEALYDQAVASSGPTIGVDEKEIEAARAALRSAQASVGIYQAQRGKRTIVSPVSGIISKRYVDEGEIAPMGGSPLLTIVTADSLQFAATVSELDVDRVMVGSEVTVTVDGLPNAEITGRVAQVLPAGEVSSRNFTIKIAIPAGQGVKPGMFARGEVVVGAAQDAVIIPKDTLIEEAGQMMAYIVEGNAAKRQTVTLGIEGVAVVEVLEGVNPGDKVVIRGQKGLTDGASVTIDNTVEYDLPTNGLNDAEPEPEKATGDS
ncbi:MAG: efflux RND transporter periplasmic adaptor subunit [Armatimonadota bacterium]